MAVPLHDGSGRNHQKKKALVLLLVVNTTCELGNRSGLSISVCQALINDKRVFLCDWWRIEATSFESLASKINSLILLI